MGASVSSPTEYPLADMPMIASPAASAAAAADGAVASTVILQLTPSQSCRVHGWTNPRRTLTWDDVVRNPGITVRKCVEEVPALKFLSCVLDMQQCLTHSFFLRKGIPVEDLHEMQPDIGEWIRKKQVSFPDVRLMTLWPLHPIEHLKGDISDLVPTFSSLIVHVHVLPLTSEKMQVAERYDPRILQRLGIQYRYMREKLQMSDDWMRMLRYHPKEWKEYLGFGELEAEQMGDLRLEQVFLMDPGMLRVAMNAP